MHVPNILCLKIELIDFPFDAYTLNIMGKNVKTSKHNIFDFSTEITNAMIEINMMQKVIMDNRKEPPITIPQNINYLHIRQNDWVSIGHNKKTVLKDIQYVKLFGYILENNIWKYGEQTVKLYSNNVNSIPANLTTPFMDFYFEHDKISAYPDDIKKKMDQYDYRRFLRIQWCSTNWTTRIYCKKCIKF